MGERLQRSLVKPRWMKQQRPQRRLEQQLIEVAAECADCGVWLKLEEVVLIEPGPDDEDFLEAEVLEVCYKCAGQRLLDSQYRCECGYPLLPYGGPGGLCVRCEQRADRKKSVKQEVKRPAQRRRRSR
jgi:hypothetical protein